MPAVLHLPRISTNVRFAASALLFPELADESVTQAAAEFVQ